MRILYVSDLDGTLLNSRGSLSPYTIKTINRLVEKGMLFTYATARSLSSASVVARGLDPHIPVIVYNGAYIMEPATGSILASENFTNEERFYAERKFTEYNVSPIVYSRIEGRERVSWNIRRINEGKQNYFCNRQGDRRLRPVETEEQLYEGEAFYYTCIGEERELKPLSDAFSGDARYNCTFQQELYRTEYWLEIMPKKATKSNGILKLMELWKCDKVISFGDAVNDIPMFQISDQCYAVENAVDSLKKIATGIIGDHDSDSVAKWLEENGVW